MSKIAGTGGVELDPSQWFKNQYGVHHYLAERPKDPIISAYGKIDFHICKTCEVDIPANRRYCDPCRERAVDSSNAAYKRKKNS